MQHPEQTDSARFHCEGRALLRDGKPFRIRGINLGNWLNLEDFMLGVPGTDWQIRAAFHEHLGPDVASAFFERLQEVYVTEADIAWIAARGFNLLRLPLNYRRLMDERNPGRFLEEGFKPVDRLLDWSHRHGLVVLLDLHAAPGGQNNTPPSDNTTGYTLLWGHADFQQRTVDLWRELARRYRGHPALFGYNLLNEPVTSDPAPLSGEMQNAAMNDLNRRLIRAIRERDPDLPIVIEGPLRQSGGLPALAADLFDDPNVMVSYHHYPCSGFALLPALNVASEALPPARELEPERLRLHIRRAIEDELHFARSIDRPVLLGEFGFFSPDSPAFRGFGSGFPPDVEERVVRAQLEVNIEEGFHWALWSYKDIGLMGLVTPHKDTAWRRFVESPGRLERDARIESRRQALMEEVNTVYGKNAATAKTFDAAWNDSVRAIRRAGISLFARELAALPEKDIRAMPEAFALANCAPRQQTLDVLGPFLAGFFGSAPNVAKLSGPFAPDF